MMSAPVNHCSNPNLEVDLTGWERIVGGPAQRARTIISVVGGGTDVRYSYMQNNEVSTPAAHLPSLAVTPGDTWGFSVRSAISSMVVAGTIQQRIVVRWYDASGFLIGKDNGRWKETNYGSLYVGDLFTVPAGVVRADIIAEIDGSVVPNSWALDEAFYALGELYPEYAAP